MAVKLNCCHVVSCILSGLEYATLLYGVAYAAGDCNQSDEDSVYENESEEELETFA
jgi:hypothetical protein